jgi:hypothetical protein
MPDWPAGRYRSTRLRTALVLVALLAVVPASDALAKRHSSRPRVTSFAFSPASFSVETAQAAAQGQPATTIRFTLSERATVKVAIARKSKGRRSRSGRRCLEPSRKLAKRRACTRYDTKGKLVFPRLPKGPRAVAFSGRVRGRALSAGTYRARIVAIDRARHRSRSKIVTFTVRSSGASGTAPTGSTPPPPAPAPPGAQRRVVRSCSVTVGSTAAAQSAVAGAAPGTVVCLANGSYGKLTLSAGKAGEVVVQSAPPGVTTIAGADMSGSHLTLEGFNVAGDEVTVEPGSDHMTVQFNRISGGYFGVQAGPTTTTPVNDVTIRANKFVGNFGEDAIRLNRYHDSDGDGIGALIEGNEITGVVEDGAHNDCLQTVWVGDHLVYRRNYLHSNNCQGFFVKDQQSPIDTIVFDDNLIVDHNLPCQPASLCPTWVLSPVQIFGPLTSLHMANNTVWTPFDNGGVYVRGSGWGSFQFVNNVTYRLSAPDGAAPFASYSASNNVTCNRENPWPATGVASACSLPFPNPAAQDYRLGNGRGVDWAPADQQYGP